MQPTRQHHYTPACCIHLWRRFSVALVRPITALLAPSLTQSLLGDVLMGRQALAFNGGLGRVLAWQLAVP